MVSKFSTLQKLMCESFTWYKTRFCFRLIKYWKVLEQIPFFFMVIKMISKTFR